MQLKTGRRAEKIWLLLLQNHYEKDGKDQTSASRTRGTAQRLSITRSCQRKPCARLGCGRIWASRHKIWCAILPMMSVRRGKGAGVAKQPCHMPETSRLGIDPNRGWMTYWIALRYRARSSPLITFIASHKRAGADDLFASSLPAVFVELAARARNCVIVAIHSHNGKKENLCCLRGRAPSAEGMGVLWILQRLVFRAAAEHRTKEEICVSVKTELMQGPSTRRWNLPACPKGQTTHLIGT
ncbi:MAG: hypothetical protein U5N55_09935 [Cypionkella sp.]|nr:hypothetical protein [Cypionkella sp.]